MENGIGVLTEINTAIPARAALWCRATACGDAVKWVPDGVCVCPYVRSRASICRDASVDMDARERRYSRSGR